MIVQVVMVPSQSLEVANLEAAHFWLSGADRQRVRCLLDETRYALVIAIVPPCGNVHHQKQTLYPAHLPLGERICSFVTKKILIKNEDGQKWDFCIRASDALLDMKK